MVPIIIFVVSSLLALSNIGNTCNGACVCPSFPSAWSISRVNAKRPSLCVARSVLLFMENYTMNAARAWVSQTIKTNIIII